MNFIEKKERKQKQLYENLYSLQKINAINRPFLFNPKYQSIIPLQTFTCWHTKNLPPVMKLNYERITKMHTIFKHYLFDDQECHDFIKSNFDNDVLHAYECLIPSSYKSDLWRYCVLYIHGGIYFDIKFECVNGFRFIALTDKEYFVRDREIKGANGTLNGLIAVKPGNEIMYKCIRQIVENVKNKFYGENCLEPTGPNLLGKYFTKEDKMNMELYFANIKIQNIKDEWIVIFNNVIILRQYTGYRGEQSKKHYSVLWNERNIYSTFEKVEPNPTLYKEIL
jgi:mannosyltransferase OCH1-like enzyme